MSYSLGFIAGNDLCASGFPMTLQVPAIKIPQTKAWEPVHAEAWRILRKREGWPPKTTAEPTLENSPALKRVLSAMGDDWILVRDLADLMDKDAKAIATCLCHLRRLGLVESRLAEKRSGALAWRKK